jgi:hypothetical protein
MASITPHGNRGSARARDVLRAVGEQLKRGVEIALRHLGQ